MNLMVLHNLCQKASRECFEDFKHSIDNLPYGITPKESLNDIITFEIKQKLGGKVLKRVIANYDLSLKQIQFATNIIDTYKKLVIRTSLNYYKKNHLN